MMKTTLSFLYYGLPLLAGVLLLPIPLLRDLHIESALLVSVAGCFWSAWSACNKKYVGIDRQQIFLILRTVYLVGIPLLLYAIVTGCLSLHGIGFWVLYPVPSVLLGYSLGRLLRKWDVPFRRAISVAVVLFIAAGVLMIEFFNLPQVYFFNHVWGGWPGPIYDETVTVGWSLVFYRGMTLAWAGLLWWIPVFNKSVQAKAAVILCAVLLMIGYSRLAGAGIITPRSYLQQQLGGAKQTAHFSIYYDQQYYSDEEAEFIAKKHEFYFRQIIDRLNIEWPDDPSKIESYLYAHPWQKKELVGAKFTSYVPVWLDQDQLHIAKPQIAGSLKHELVHVLAKQFGNKLFNASWSIGLIEGLAVAVAPGQSRTTTVDQLVVSEKPYPGASEMKRALSPMGFYGGRSAVNYTQAGSFVQYLLQKYPVDTFKQAYKNGSIAGAYSTSFDSLVGGWHRVLEEVAVDSTDRQVAERLYGFPSLFEQECPHVQSAFAQRWDRYRYFMAEGDTLQALTYLEQAYRETETNQLVKNQLAWLNLKAGNYKRVQQLANITDSTAEGLLLYADAFAMDAQTDAAEKYVKKAARRLAATPDSTLQQALQVRRDSGQWKYYRDIVYRNTGVGDSTFQNLHLRTQVRTVRRAIERGNRTAFLRYGRLLAGQPTDLLYVDTYLDVIEHLAFYGKEKVADRMITSLKTHSLRARYQERLQQAIEWVHFLENEQNHSGL